MVVPSSFVATSTLTVRASLCLHPWRIALASASCTAIPISKQLSSGQPCSSRKVMISLRAGAIWAGSPGIEKFLNIAKSHRCVLQKHELPLNRAQTDPGNSRTPASGWLHLITLPRLLPSREDGSQVPSEAAHETFIKGH